MVLVCTDPWSLRTSLANQHGSLRLVINEPSISSLGVRHMRSATSGRAGTATRLAAISAASVLVIGVLPSNPAAATTLDTVPKIADALCPTGANSTGGTAVLSQDVITPKVQADVSGDPDRYDEVLAVAVGCVATLDLNGKTLALRSINLGTGSTLTIKDAVGGGEIVAEGAGARNNSGPPGIDAGGATLIIQSGKIDAKGGSGNAGIRTFDGILRVEGGIVDAVGGSNAAGIGASSASPSDPDGGTVEISGGTVTATGTEGGAGIGGRRLGAGGTVEISGGTVTATGDIGGAGIGGGGGGGVGGAGGTVTISGGTVTATGGDAGAGIGGGGDRDGNSTGSAGATVMITGGSVVATAGATGAKAIGAGAGDGSNGDGTLTLGPGSVRVDSVTDGDSFPVTSIAFPTSTTSSTPAGPSFFAPGGVQPSQPVASAAFVRADGSPQDLRVSVPGRDQVRYEADGIRVTLQGGPGTDVARGLVANPAGEIACEVCITGLTAGQVVEVWLFSTPRLVAAHLTDDAECQLFTVPLSSPLDGGGPVAAGAHTLQFTLATASGLEAVNVGLTVGGLVPTSVPAGEGPVTPYALVALMLVVLLGIRRAAVTRA
jgi:hypothetical protein